MSILTNHAQEISKINQAHWFSFILLHLEEALFLGIDDDDDDASNGDLGIEDDDDELASRKSVLR